MKLTWEIEDSDVAGVKAFYSENKNYEFVVHRRKTNVCGRCCAMGRPTASDLLKRLD